MVPDWTAGSAVHGQALPLKLRVRLQFTLFTGSSPVQQAAHVMHT